MNRKLIGVAALAMFAVYPGMVLTKDAPPASDADAQNAALATLNKELGDITAMLKTSKEAVDKQFTELHAHYDGVKGDNEDLKKTVEKHAADYADLIAKHQALTQALDQVKKELDAPLLKGGSDLEESDRKAAIELQRRLHLSKGGTNFDFKEDLDNLVDVKSYRGAAYKMMQGGLAGFETKDKLRATMSEYERKAFDAASLDSGFFSPEMLGIEIDCNIECAELLDLYDSVSVTKSMFMYPKIESYGDIGAYDCDAKCDAEMGPEGNIRWLNGKTYDFRGVFCFQRKVLQEANYDLLGFMMRAAARSHRINRNRALITGDGLNEPQGWLTADCFTKIATTGLGFNHQIWRRFLASAPVEYGPVVATMHQNVFAYLAAYLDDSGRFIFGDGDMTFSPDSVSERIRISNCLPDATAGGTRGSAAAPFVAGDFIAAAGNWDLAYAAVEKRPMWMEQYIGGSSAWCVKYQFGAEDGGFVKCCPAARTLVVGA